MAKTIYINKLLRLTLTRRGKAIAKHPLLRENVVEAVKATPIEKSSHFETTWETPKTTPEETLKAASNDAPSLARFQSGRYQ